MKKIAYIEIDTHAEIAQSFMEIMRNSQVFSVEYYLSKKIKNHVNENDESIFLSDSSIILDQLKSKKYDLIIIGTAHRYFNTFLAVTKKYNTAIIAHNLNFPHTSRLNLMKSVFKEDIIFRLKLCWKEGLFYASKVYKKAKNILVLDKELSSEKHQFLPIFFTKYFEKIENNDFVIVIPGGVSQKRRNYEHVFEILQNSKILGNYTFVFLGKAKDNELNQLENLSENLPKNYKIEYFKERVSSNDFDNWMQKADVLWCPIRQEIAFFSQKEMYGTTKMTGNLGDAIKYGKLAVFPKNYPSTLEFIIPENENVFEQFKELKNKNFDFQKNYNKKTVQENLKNILYQLIIK